MGTRLLVERERVVEAVRFLRRGEGPVDWYPDPQVWQDWPVPQRRRWLNVTIATKRTRSAKATNTDVSQDAKP
ncbi:MAG: hypothetical protein HOA57_02085 [Candidatus Magasanikbacteria bacterium]|jgi:hypothetical protein|nr:hypothetical protein [Candidatus Magasanikbacteria bacterium]MBT4314551.1 hypothetical protein [Candidatus Magasanikbacteria bacterium]MBT4547449.1 hypothetical protein [Candidatus Magasanikbacteria bacterium]MBT6819144.1 hypothetical protein [Candidatus Magasanikbacteria bacterium]